MGFLARFFSSYSESFTAAMLAWPFASFALTLPILALLYHRDGRIRLLSAAGAYLSVLYLLGLVCFTLYPLPEGDSGPGITYGLDPIWNPLHFVDDIAADGMPAVAQLVANVALFVPFGFIAGRGLRLGVPASVAWVFLHRSASRLPSSPVCSVFTRMRTVPSRRPTSPRTRSVLSAGGCWRGRRCASCLIPEGLLLPPSRRVPAS